MSFPRLLGQGGLPRYRLFHKGGRSSAQASIPEQQMLIERDLEWDVAPALVVAPEERQLTVAQEANSARASTDSLPVVVPSEGLAHRATPCIFEWNGKRCKGNALHEAVLKGNRSQVESILEAEAEAVDSTFSYLTYYNNKKQEGAGQAIHLAASRGRRKIMDILLDKKASLEAMVKRDGKDHYDVLQAAVFAEGRRGNLDMVRYLVEVKKVPMRPNSDGRWPLHMAFQVGCQDKIKFIREAMHEVRDMPPEDALPRRIGDSGPTAEAPLLIGIQNGNMTTGELATAAARTEASLRVFMEYEPRCIPKFLELLEDKSTSKETWKVEEHIKGSDLARVIRRCPEAAQALFENITATPTVKDEGWHPLPRRVSFAPGGVVERVRHLVNPQKEMLVHYEKESEWLYDCERFRPPVWHQDFQPPTHGDPVHDVDVQVCRVPNILCAEFFAALADADEDGQLQVFNNTVVSGAANFVWWNGAWRVDLLQCLLGVWGLSLLILESWIVGGDGDPFTDPAARRLEHMRKHLTASGSESRTFSDLLGTIVPGEITVSAAFLGAKGLLDVLHEMAQLAGSARIGRALDYCNWGNAFDLARGLILMSLFFDTRRKELRVLVIFICWMRLLEMFTSAENIALALLPLKRLARSLVPASVVTLVAFLAFTHVFHFVWGNDHNWNTTFFQSFATLITTELPENPGHHPLVEIVVTYGATIFFSMFILNIFIGVIGTQYEAEKERVPQTFLHHRACCCLNFLLRARVLPCQLLSRVPADLINLLAIGVCFLLQVVGLFADAHMWKPPMLRVWFFIIQSVMLLMAYQNPHGSWCPCSAEQRFLWLTTPSALNEVLCTTCERPFGKDDAFCPKCGARRPKNEELARRVTSTLTRTSRASSTGS